MTKVDIMHHILLSKKHIDSNLTTIIIIIKTTKNYIYIYI